jgi:hypothetical protein
MSKIIKHIDGNVGGYLVGKRHSEGGIKAINKSTNQPLEMEGGEVVITRNAVSDNTKKEFEGEMLTNREILSHINESGGGVSFEKGGEIYSYGNKFNYGGHLMTDHEILHCMAIGGELEEYDELDLDFDEKEYALGGTLTSGLELTDLEGGAFIQSGNNYPPMKVINYNSFPIYIFVDYREKKQKTLRKPLKLTNEADGLIRVYEYQHVSANLHDWVLIDNVDNISKLYQYLDSIYVSSTSIVVCNYEFYKNKSSLQRKILNLLNEFSRYDDKRTSTRKGINKAIEEMDTYQNSYIKQNVDDFENTQIKRVYFTQDIDWTKNSAIPKTDLDGYVMTNFFLIMHNRKQILTTLSRIKPSITGKSHWNFFVIEFEDGRMRFDILSLKQNQNPINFDDIINTSTPRNEETVTILTNSQYLNNSLAPDFVISDSDRADKQIKELPTTVIISSSTNNQTFRVGDNVEYIGDNPINLLQKGDKGVITKVKTNVGFTNLNVDFNVLSNGIPSIRTYIINDSLLKLVQAPQSTQLIQSEIIIPENAKFKVGNEVEYVGNSVGNLENGDKGVVTNVNNFSLDVDFKVLINGNYTIRNFNTTESQIKLVQEPQSTQTTTPKNEFKVGDFVKYIGQDKNYFKNGDIGEVIDLTKGLPIGVKINGYDWGIDASQLELVQNKFKVGDEVKYIGDDSPYIKKGHVGKVTKYVKDNLEDLVGVESNQWLLPISLFELVQSTTIPSVKVDERKTLTMLEQELDKQINDLTDLLNITPEYDFEDRIAISQELSNLQIQKNVYVAQNVISTEFVATGKLKYEIDVIDLMLNADCVQLSQRPTNSNPYQNGFSPNGKPTALNRFNYDLIHTEQFQKWFGNYGLAYNYSKLGDPNIGIASKVVNKDGEPLVVYMGVGRAFEKITFTRFPIGYFAVNEAYAEWFATTKGNDGVGYVLPFFLNIRRPLDFSMFGIDDVPPKDFFDWLYLETGMTGKELGFDDRWFLPNQPALKIWMYIRNCPNFLNKLKEYKICDGIHFYENNPANPIGSDNYMTEVWTIFYSNQCKLASQDRSEMILSANNSFLMKKGGLVK